MTGPTYLFTCCICRRDVTEWYPECRRGRDRQIPPICNTCEGSGDRAPQAGSLMDRRQARRLSAIANELQGAAYRKEWEAKYYGRA